MIRHSAPCLRRRVAASFAGLRAPGGLPGGSWPTAAARARTVASAAPATREIPREISVHKGRKIQAALCIERPPIAVVQPDFKAKWEAFRSAWLARTKNDLAIDDEIVFMKYYFHFLRDTRQRGLSGGGAPSSQLEEGAGASSLEAGSGGLDSLLSQQGLDGLSFPEHGQKTVRKRRKKSVKVAEVDDADLRSHQRLASQVLFLLVRYSGATKWTFPKAERVHGQAMWEVLDRLCERQLEFQDLPPYVVGACPFAYRKLNRAGDDGIIGRKVFYYRARITGAYAAVTLPDESTIDDFAWCSRDELRKMLGDGEWCAVRECLPLDSVA